MTVIFLVLQSIKERSYTFLKIILTKSITYVLVLILSVLHSLESILVVQQPTGSFQPSLVLRSGSGKPHGCFHTVFAKTTTLHKQLTGYVCCHTRQILSYNLVIPDPLCQV